MGAASADVPAIMLTGGPAEPAVFRGRQLGAGTDLWHYVDELRAGRMTRAEFDELEAAATPSVGHCNEMGTASTMASLVEALGMCLPGTASIPAVDAARRRAAEATGRGPSSSRSTALAVRVLTPAAFDNAITLLMALGGATNAVLHLLALAGRRRCAALARPLRRALAANAGDRERSAVGEPICSSTFTAPAAVAGRASRARAAASTGVPDRRPGQPLADGFVGRRDVRDRDVISALSRSPKPRSGRHSQCCAATSLPRGSNQAFGRFPRAAAPSRPRARVRDVYDVQARIDDDNLPVTPDSVLVLRNSGPHGGPGMPEWGQIPIPRKLLSAGVSDMVRVSDARMSGTAFGTVVLHVAPESAAGGPLALVEDGDAIVLDVSEGETRPGYRL